MIKSHVATPVFILFVEMLPRNILLRTEIQIDNAQGEAAGGATIEQQASAKPEPKLISVRDSQRRRRRRRRRRRPSPSESSSVLILDFESM